ncbi:MAG: hypothetical protein IAB93_05185 [Bacteroidetes bacterium]|uniref:6-phosphogluconate dehydrogenase n=1 Tax=Candidatus Merdivivens pullistercoris TaxID=2840873 RepID=A0A9D9I3P3_9BACT|nr:hypothetical protein [Candidatus Merdivivens pullistercoris]
MKPVKRKIVTIVSVIAVIALAAFIYFKFYFVFGEGVKAGNLNFVVYKGYVFKTYEGKVIQAGFTGRNNTTSIQSYEFEFSITDKTIADSLMRCSGREVELHYKEYLGALPWRGMQKYIVDDIIAVKD